MRTGAVEVSKLARTIAAKIRHPNVDLYAFFRSGEPIPIVLQSPNVVSLAHVVSMETQLNVSGMMVRIELRVFDRDLREATSGLIGPPETGDQR